MAPIAGKRAPTKKDIEEENKRLRKKIEAQQAMNEYLDSQWKAGVPYQSEDEEAVEVTGSEKLSE